MRRCTAHALFAIFVAGALWSRASEAADQAATAPFASTDTAGAPGNPTEAQPPPETVPPSETMPPGTTTLNFDGTSDWIELTSGEWLKGKIKGMVEGELVFDSDKLDDLTLDWDDIAQIRSPRAMRMMLDDQSTVLGRVSMKDGDVIVAGHAPIPRDQVVIMVPQRMSEIQFWSIQVTAGATFQSGNTEQLSYNIVADVTRQSVTTRLHAGYIGNYSKNLDVITTNNQRANAFFDYFLNRLVFIRFAQAEYYFNPFQNIALEFSVGPGVGLQFYRESKLKWDLVAGPAYEFTSFESVEAGEPDNSTTAAGRLSTTIATKPFKDFKLGGTYQVAFTNERSGLVTSHLVGTASYKLVNSVFALRVSAIWDRIQSPTANENGEVPERDDFQLVLGFGVDY